MCLGFTSVMKLVNDTVEDGFRKKYSDLVNRFWCIDNIEKILSSVYYIAGWLLSSVEKVSQ